MAVFLHRASCRASRESGTSLGPPCKRRLSDRAIGFERVCWVLLRSRTQWRLLPLWALFTVAVLLSGGCSAEPTDVVPTIQLETPTKGATDSPSFRVAGTVDPSDSTVTMSVNGAAWVELSNREGSFSGSVYLVEGRNEILVRATDASDERETIPISIEIDYVGPVPIDMQQLYETLDGFVVIVGRTLPDAVLTWAGRVLRCLTGCGTFSHPTEVPEGRNRLRIRCERRGVRPHHPLSPTVWHYDRRVNLQQLVE